VDPVRIAVLFAGVFFLVFGLTAYRYFYTVLGATVGLAVWVGLKDSLVQIPGLRDHPGTASLLLLVFFVLAAMFLAFRFRRLLVFFAGLGTGLILSQAFAVFMAEGVVFGAVLRFNRVSAMDVLVGLICGVLFVLLEGVFAVLLTSAVGSFLCTWALGGRWTFLACLVAGVAAQLLVYMKFRPVLPGPGGKDGTGSKRL